MNACMLQWQIKPLLWSPIPYMELVFDGPPYLIWNRYCMVPPYAGYDFFRPALKESTASPNYVLSYNTYDR